MCISIILLTLRSCPQAREAVGQAYVITDGIAPPLERILRMLCANGRETADEIRPAQLAKNGPPRDGDNVKVYQQAAKDHATGRWFSNQKKSLLSIEKGRRELGYQPRLSLQEGMQITEQWLREGDIS